MWDIINLIIDDFLKNIYLFVFYLFLALRSFLWSQRAGATFQLQRKGFWLRLRLWLQSPAPGRVGFCRRATGLIRDPPRHVGSSPTRDRTCVPLHHKADSFFFFYFFLICSEFCHTLKWNSLGFTRLPHPDPPSHLPLHPLPPGLPRAPGPSACLMHPTWAGDLFHPW